MKTNKPKMDKGSSPVTKPKKLPEVNTKRRRKSGYEIMNERVVKQNGPGMVNERLYPKTRRRPKIK